jgi:hypothetical protein
MATNGRSDAATESSAWYCEEQVRSRLVLWLRDHGYFQTNDATALDSDDALVVRSVYGAISRIAIRGFPGGDAHKAARQWFASALLDLALRRTSDADVGLALALPAGFTVYATLAAEIAWLRGAMPFTIYWVAESGKVQAE